MKDMLKKIGDKIGTIVAYIIGIGLLVVLFIPIVILSAIDTIKERKLHLFIWDIQDAYVDLINFPKIFALFVFIITIPLAIMEMNKIKEDRELRAQLWEAKHPGKIA